MTPTNIDPKAIQAHFAKYPGAKYVDGWASLRDKGDNLPWDRGFPNPALEDILVQRAAGTIGGPIIADQDGGGWRKKALVPGCGRGVDVLLFASFGYDAYGLDCSAAAVEACREEEKEKESHSWYRVRDEKVGKGKVTFVQGNFFDDAWLEEIGNRLPKIALILGSSPDKLVNRWYPVSQHVLIPSVDASSCLRQNPRDGQINLPAPAA